LQGKNASQHSHSERAHPAAQLPDRASPRQTVLTTEGQPAENSPDYPLDRGASPSISQPAESPPDRDHYPAPSDKHGSDRAELGRARLG
jgi:hypothetical protein